MTNEWILYTDFLDYTNRTEQTMLLRQTSIKYEFLCGGEIVKRKHGGGTILTKRHVDNDYQHARYHKRSRRYAWKDVGKIEVLLNWNDEQDDWEFELVDPKDYYIRMDQKQFEKYVKVKELLQVGDFVRFSGSTRRYAWRKIITINGNSAYGQCASKPTDESLVSHSSENGLLTVMEIIRNGEKIF